MPETNTEESCDDPSTSSQADTSDISVLMMGLADDSNYQAYMNATENYIKKIDNETTTENDAIVKVLFAYRKDEFENMKFYLSTNTFCQTKHELLRDFYRRCYERWAAKMGIRGESTIAYPMSIAGKDTQTWTRLCELTSRRKRSNICCDIHRREMKKEKKQRHMNDSFHTYELLIQNRQFLIYSIDGSGSDMILSLCRNLLDEDWYTNYMSVAATALRYNKTSIGDKIVLLRILFAYRNKEIGIFKNLIKNNVFLPQNHEALRELYVRYHRKCVGQENIKFNFPSSISFGIPSDPVICEDLAINEPKETREAKKKKVPHWITRYRSLAVESSLSTEARENMDSIQFEDWEIDILNSVETPTIDKIDPTNQGSNIPIVPLAPVDAEGSESVEESEESGTPNKELTPVGRPTRSRKRTQPYESKGWKKYPITAKSTPTSSDRKSGRGRLRKPQKADSQYMTQAGENNSGSCSTKSAEIPRNQENYQPSQVQNVGAGEPKKKAVWPCYYSWLRSEDAAKKDNRKHQESEPVAERARLLVEEEEQDMEQGASVEHRAENGTVGEIRENSSRESLPEGDPENDTANNLDQEANWTEQDGEEQIIEKEWWEVAEQLDPLLEQILANARNAELQAEGRYEEHHVAASVDSCIEKKCIFHREN